MTSVVEHDFTDAALIADVVKLGALPPAYTREKHPGVWDCWEARAFWVRTCAARGSAVDLADAIAECDRYSGQPLPEKPASVAPVPVAATARASLDVLEMLGDSVARYLRGAPA